MTDEPVVGAELVTDAGRGPLAALRAAVGGRSVLPLAVLFGFFFVDQVATNAFGVLTPAGLLDASRASLEP